MVIKITGNKIHGNGIGISLPSEVEAEIDGNEMINNGKAIEIRESVNSLFNDFKKEIINSKLDSSSKERLLKEVLRMINTRGNIEKEKQTLISRFGIFLGKKSIDLLVQIAATVISSKL